VPTDYLYRLFSADNLPNILLFLAGVAGIIVAIRTLQMIKRQTEITEKTLVLTQRPRIVVKTFYFSEPKGDWWCLLCPQES